MSTGNITGLTATPVAVGKPPSSLKQVWWLARVNLFLVRRRVLGKVLAILLVVFYLLSAGLLSIGLLVAEDGCAHADGCQRSEVLSGVNQTIMFPHSLGLAGSFLQLIGVLFMCVMVGAMIGGEYGYGTHRLSLPRGLSRLQVLLGQVLATALMALMSTIVIFLLAAFVGLSVGPALGGTFESMDLNGALELIAYLLAVALNLFAYGMVAMFFATLGRSAAAGIAVSIGYIAVESVLSGILATIALVLQGKPGAAIAQAYQWFPGPSFGALVSNAGSGPIALAAPTKVSLIQCAIMSVVYISVFVVGSYLLYRTRDITD